MGKRPKYEYERKGVGERRKFRYKERSLTKIKLFWKEVSVSGNEVKEVLR